jgi:hypothetical protein
VQRPTSIKTTRKPTQLTPPPQGPMGPTGTGAPGPAGPTLNPRGEYNPATIYARLDLVSLNGSSWIAMQSVQGVTPSASAPQWMPSAERGAAGSAGSTIAPINFAFGDASPRVIYTVPDTSLINEVSILIRVPYSGAPTTIQIGTASNPGLLVPLGLVEPGDAVSYELSPDIDLPAGTPILLTQTVGPGTSAGSGVILLGITPL